jgi:Glycosyl hydrolase family 1
VLQRNILTARKRISTTAGPPAGVISFSIALAQSIGWASARGCAAPSAICRNVMAPLQRATAEGVPVKGNFVRSAVDNLEWTDGYGTRFGMV